VIAPVVHTIGHSTRSLEALVALLMAHGVERVVDVRRFPGSRRHPQFGREALAGGLAAAGIEHVWVEALGGRRRRRPDSPHTAWRVEAFAAYADHMETAEFVAAAARLLLDARQSHLAVMCAEARPEQCHRRLIADWLTVRGAQVHHITSATRAVPHRLPDFARLVGDTLRYDGGQPELPLGGAPA
jgi:uncharacterized protein (DUF488 family)